MNNKSFVKSIENVRKHREVKLATNKSRSNYLVSEPNYQITKFGMSFGMIMQNQKIGKKNYVTWMKIPT